MGQQAEGAPRGFHRIRGVAHWVSNYLNSTDGAPVSPGLGQQEAVQPPLVQRAPQQAVRRQIGSIEPAQVPSTREARREAARIAYLTRQPDGSGGSKRKHRTREAAGLALKGSAIPQSLESQEAIKDERQILVSPRFVNDFERLPDLAKEEVLATVHSIKERNGIAHQIEVEKERSVFTSYRHAGPDNERVIFQIRQGTLYIICVLRGHDYGKNTKRGIHATIEKIPYWERDNKMMNLQGWLESIGQAT